MKKSSVLVLIALLGACFLSQNASAATVNYSGKIFVNGQPVPNEDVNLMYFASGFDPDNFFRAYGDGYGNAAPGQYQRAIADNAVFPLDSTPTDSSGIFQNSVSTNAPIGTQLWLYIEPNLSFSSYMAIASSSDPSWLVSNSTTFDAKDANIFAYGSGESHPEGIGLTLAPIPEPGSICLAFIAAIGFISFACKRKTNQANSH